MADLRQQNQELTREVNRHRRQCRGEEHRQNSENRGAENNAERDQSKGTVTRRVPHLEIEMDQMKKAMEEMKDSMRRENHMDEVQD